VSPILSVKAKYWTMRQADLKSACVALVIRVASLL